MFNRLSTDEKNTVISFMGKPEVLFKGDELYKNGNIGIIFSGSATIKRLNDIGDSITIRTISQNELFGAASVFGDWKNGMSSITANEKCEVYYINQEVFENIMLKYPQVSISYIEYLSDKIRFLNRKLDAFTTKSTEERLYEYLLSQSDNDGNIHLNFGMAELARRLNVGRTSVYRDIESLQSKELITRNGHSFKIKK